MHQNITLTTQQIDKYFFQTKILTDISLKFKCGKIHGLLGPNGAGKTTLMNILAHVFRPTNGNIFLGQLNLFNNIELWKKSIAYLPEILPLYTELTAEENWLFSAKLYGQDNEKTKKLAIEYAQFLGVEKLKNSYVSTLSKGQKQIVALICVLILKTPVLMLDEPFSGLDPEALKKIKTLLKRREKNTLIILSTHRLHEVSELCERISFINHGKIYYSGPWQDWGQSQSQFQFKLNARPNQELYEKLKKEKYVNKVIKEGVITILELDEVKSCKFVIEKFMNEGIQLEEFSRFQPKLDEIFLKLENSTQKVNQL